MKHPWLKTLLPMAVLAVSGLLAVAMILARPEPERRPPEVTPPVVRVVPVSVRAHTFVVRSQGTVLPATRTTLAAEIGGRILEVSPSLVLGGRVRRGEVLARLDPADAAEAVARAEAALAQAQVRLERERAEAAVAVEEWRELHGDAPAPPLTSREIFVQEAEASLEAARAALELARHNLERTRIRAPFDALVEEKLADVGQFVARGQPVARIHATDRYEVALPVPDDDLRYLDLGRLGSAGAKAGAIPVRLKARFGGSPHVWEARLDRMGAEIDPRTRMVTLVAVLDDPRGRGRERGTGAELQVGLFVQAEILGRTVSDAVVLPRAALREDGRVWIVDAGGRLRPREVEILRQVEDRLVVRGGLEPGDSVCITPLARLEDGMAVVVAGQEPDREAEAS